MEQRRILVIDDDEEVRAYLELLLDRWGFAVESAADSGEGVRRAETFNPDLIITDLLLPGFNGIDLTHRLCDQGRRPVLIMSGMSDQGGVLSSAAGAAGAREFLAKPLTETALFDAITRVLGCEPAPSGHEDLIERGPLRLDPERRRVWLRGKLLKGIGPTRFRLLSALVKHRDGASRQTLRLEVWGEGENLKAVDVAVLRLRRDFAAAEPGFDAIAAIPGGYKLVLR